MKQTISVLVENQAGVLNRITGLFSRRAFNIDSLAVGVTDDPTISRITIIVDSGNSVVEQVEKQLNKLVEVIKVRTIPEDKKIGRELVLLKVNATNKTRQDIMTICDIMGAKVDDISPNSLTLELSDTPDRIDTFEAMLRPFSILEVVRTGVIALQKLVHSADHRWGLAHNNIVLFPLLVAPEHLAAQNDPAAGDVGIAVLQFAVGQRPVDGVPGLVNVAGILLYHGAVQIVHIPVRPGHRPQLVQFFPCNGPKASQTAHFKFAPYSMTSLI